MPPNVAFGICRGCAAVYRILFNGFTTFLYLESLAGIVSWNRGTGKYSIEYSGESEFSFFLLDVLEKEIILKYFDSKQV